MVNCTCPCVSPADFPASNCRARPKSAMQAVRLLFNSTFLLLMSLKTHIERRKIQSVQQSVVTDAVVVMNWFRRRRRTCERWRACVRPCVPGCLHGGRPGRGLSSERCGTARSTTPRWPSGSLSASPAGTIRTEKRHLTFGFRDIFS